MLTSEQLAIRKSRLSATDLAAIFGVSPYRNAADVQAEKLYDVEPVEATEPIKLGIMFERPIIERAALELGIAVEYPLPTIISTASPILCATPDAGSAGVDGDPGVGIEAKTAGIVRGWVEAGEWGEPGSDEIPDRHKVQTLCQMAVTGWRSVHVAAVVAGRGFVLYEVPRSEDDIDGILEIAPRWWHRHIVNREPCVDAEGRTLYPALQTLRRIRRKPNSPRDVPASIVSAYLSATAIEKQAQEKREAAKAALLACIGDGDAAALDDIIVATFYRQKRKAFTVEAGEFPVLRLDKHAAEFVAAHDTRKQLTPSPRTQRSAESTEVAT